MKVIYETIGTTIRKAIFNADNANRRIDHIEVSVSEANDLKEEFRKLYSEIPWHHFTTKDWGKTVGNYMGVWVRVEDAPEATKE